MPREGCQGGGRPWGGAGGGSHLEAVVDVTSRGVLHHDVQALVLCARGRRIGRDQQDNGRGLVEPRWRPPGRCVARGRREAGRAAWWPSGRSKSHPRSSRSTSCTSGCRARRELWPVGPILDGQALVGRAGWCGCQEMGFHLVDSHLPVRLVRIGEIHLLESELPTVGCWAQRVRFLRMRPWSAPLRKTPSPGADVTTAPTRTTRYTVP